MLYSKFFNIHVDIFATICRAFVLYLVSGVLVSAIPELEIFHLFCAVGIVFTGVTWGSVTAACLILTYHFSEKHLGKPIISEKKVVGLAIIVAVLTMVSNLEYNVGLEIIATKTFFWGLVPGIVTWLFPKEVIDFFRVYPVEKVKIS